MISVLIIAHNESAHIAECLAAIEKQTRRPDEIVVVSHNSVDDTAKIARGFPGVRVEEYTTPERGPILARIRAFELASHELIVCIDGNTIARPDWIEQLVRPLEGDPEIVGVGGMIWFKGSLGGNLAAFYFFLLSRLAPGGHFYFWGANFACRKSAYEACGGIRPFLALRSKLQLIRWAEDCYLSLALEKVGRVVFARRAIVDTYPSEEEVHTPVSPRAIEQEWDRKRLFRHFEVRC